MRRYRLECDYAAVKCLQSIDVSAEVGMTVLDVTASDAGWTARNGLTYCPTHSGKGKEAMGLRLGKPPDDDNERALFAIRVAHEGFVDAVNFMRNQTIFEVAKALGVSVDHIKSLWLSSGCM